MDIILQNNFIQSKLFDDLNYTTCYKSRLQKLEYNLIDNYASITNIILIDEPEISLHPKWQREYVLKIYDYFYKNDIKLFIATHAPLIISKVQVSNADLYQNYIQKIKYNIFKVNDQQLQKVIEDDDYSVESLYWEVFGILTPDNAFLSRHCTVVG